MNLYLTSGTTLSGLTDASGIGGTLSGSLTTLATAGTNTGFRGVGLFVPEPGSVGLLVLTLPLALRRRRTR